MCVEICRHKQEEHIHLTANRGYVRGGNGIGVDRVRMIRERAFQVSLYICIYILKILFYYLFLERGEGREKERERNTNMWLPLKCPQLGTWPATQACALTGNQTSDPLVLRSVLKPLSHSSQGYFYCLKLFSQ